MAIRLIIATILLMTGVAWGGESVPHCLACHQTHYRDRGSCRSCHGGNELAARRAIAHSGLRAGRYVRFRLDGAVVGSHLIERFACRRCHITHGKGNRLAAHLDESARRLTPQQLESALRQPARAMPDFRLADEQTVAVINALYAGAHGTKGGAQVPTVVHFAGSGQTPDLFTRRCGTCHRMLTTRHGSIGSGDVAPNLSGLLSGYYPRTFRNNGSWSSVALLAWLKNPRLLRPYSTMPPQVLSEREQVELLEIMKESQAGL